LRKFILDDLTLSEKMKGGKILTHFVTDSSCDLPLEFIEEHNIETVPLTIRVNNQEFNEGINITPHEFYELMYNSKSLPKTAHPSPASFARVFDKLGKDGEDVICLTIASTLSGAYQSACIAKNMTKTIVHVFDTLAASSGHALQVMKAVELSKQCNMTSEIIEKLKKYRDKMDIFILLDTLDNIIKGGRLSKLHGTIAKIMDVKVLLRNFGGTIKMVEKIRGKKKSLKKVLEMIGQSKNKALSDNYFYITHVDNAEDAEFIKKEIMRLFSPKGVFIHEMGPTVSTYAGKGGLIISY
jgi:DegV family protein with EDD domain